jgi:hypothetical protein
MLAAGKHLQVCSRCVCAHKDVTVVRRADKDSEKLTQFRACKETRIGAAGRECHWKFRELVDDTHQLDSNSQSPLEWELAVRTCLHENVEGHTKMLNCEIVSLLLVQAVQSRSAVDEAGEARRRSIFTQSSVPKPFGIEMVVTTGTR